MRVYRVETPEGDGPYTAADFQSVMLDRGLLHSPERQPTPGEDVLLDSVNQLRRGEDAGWMFGFKTLAAARAWCGPFGGRGYEYLEKHRFAVSIYEVPATHVLRYKRQLKFDRDAAEPMGSYSLGALVR